MKGGSIINKLEFTKTWLSKDDFPTYEESEEQVRKDMQCLHDETKEAFNALVDDLAAPGAAAELGAEAPGGLTGETVQELIDELAAAIGTLGGAIELEGSELAQLVAESVESDILNGYYTSVQTDQKISALGVAALEERVEDMESAFSQEGVVLGEVRQAHTFFLPGSEMAGVSSEISTQRTNCAFAGGCLVSLESGTGGLLLKKVNVTTGARTSVALSGQTLPAASTAQSYTLSWLDDAGEYMVIKAASAWYLLSLKTGLCSQLTSGSDYMFCGAARMGSLITVALYYSGQLYFYRRNVSGDSGASPSFSSPATVYEAGTPQDRLLNICGESVFVVMKYNATDSKLKLYAPATMKCSAEFSSGKPGAYPVRSICRSGTDAYFLLMDSAGVYHYARCKLSITNGAATPSIIQGGVAQSSGKFVAKGNGVVYAAEGTKLYAFNAETLTKVSEKTLPAAVNAQLCALNGAELRELWGGKYVPAGAWLLNTEDMSCRALRCNGEVPSGYAVQTAADRYFIAHAGGDWYLFDCLLRPIWGMVPFSIAGGGTAVTPPVVNTSAFGSMTEA